MRLWTLLLNHDPHETDHYIDKTFDLLDQVSVDRFRLRQAHDALLIQVDIELREPQHASERQRHIATLSHPVAYSGWLREPCPARICSSLHDDVLTIDPTSHHVIGEFSCASITRDGAAFATDHYATHPVYYHRGERGRWIASNDLRLVLLSTQVPLDIDRDACTRFLTRTVMVDENELVDGGTFFSAVKKLEPASVLTISRDGQRHRIVRRPLISYEKAASRARMGREEYVEAFKETFDRCVQDRTLAGANGLLLSGGIDSSSVLGACLATNKRAPFSVSVGFKDPDLVMSQDEKLLAALFDALSLPHQMLYVDDRLRLPDDEDACAFIDGPDVAANPLAKTACAEVLQAQRIGLVMTGEGGDIMLGEAMHDWLIDGIRESEGIKGVHRYLSKHLGLQSASPAYMRQMLASVLPSWARYEWRRRVQQESRPRYPAFLTPAVTAYAKQPERVERRTDGTGFPAFTHVGHHYMHDMLFPRAGYFDGLNLQCLHSHPFLDPRMIEFAFSCPPHMQHDYFNLDRANPYASSKMLARLAYRNELPHFIWGKTHKTSYALMARRMFQTSANALFRLTERPMLVHEWGLVDQPSFRRHLMAYIIATEDPNANLGLNYHYIRGVTDLERWLVRFSASRTHIEAHLKLRALTRPK